MTGRAVVPILIAPGNCEEATGLPWRHLRDHARALGVTPIRIGRKLALPAAALLDALTRAPPPELDPTEEVLRAIGMRIRTPADPTDEVLRSIGMRRRT